MAERSAVVVGGGISGMAAAASLTQAGWRVTVLERAASFGEVGAGLAITRNGMSALRTVGADDAVRAAGYPLFVAGTQDKDGRWLLRIPDTRADPGSMNWACGVHRQRLHATLLGVAGDAVLVPGAEVVSVVAGEPDRAPAVVTWRSADGERSMEADLVVGADGVRSVVRTLLWPEAHLAYSGYTCWRAVVDGLPDVDDRFVIAWGPWTEFGALRTSESQVYWYGYFRHPADTPFDDESRAARAHFRGWSPRVRAVVEATDAGRLIRHDVHHLPGGLRTYVHGRVVVIGDAAHALLPTMGQGANSSLEDGVTVGGVIGAPVADGAPLASALAAFNRSRRPRCLRIARRSRTTARFGAHLGDGWRQPARKAVMRLVPGAFAARTGAAVLRWTPAPGGTPTNAG